MRVQKLNWRPLLLVIAALAGLGALVAASGVVTVSADRGHWPITRWLLEFGMRRSVQTHAAGIAEPPLDDPRLVTQGARYYAVGCASCHGAPGERGSLLGQRMTPKAPPLAATLPQWRPRELFWIVREGIKYTAMPAWAAPRRDDEVWAVVAFLRQLPRLTAPQYRHLLPAPAAPDLPAGAAPASVIVRCAVCHGDDGRSAGTYFPRLAGQSQTYLLASLQAYAQGTRHSGMMQPVAAELSEGEMRALAAHYAGLPAAGARSDADDTSALRRGAAIAMQGDAARGVPPCAVCHGPGGTPRDPHFPHLAGQHVDYLALQLRLFQEDRRGGTAYAGIMQTIAGRLSPDQIEAVAGYYAALPPPP